MTFTTLALLAALSNLSSQTYASLHVNNARVVVANNGSLFWDGEEGQFIAPFAFGEPAVSTMKAAGVWFAGLDEAGNLKGAAQLYNEGGKSDFQPGIVDAETGLPLPVLQGIYRVKGAEIEAHRADFADNGIIDNPIPAIFGWPARGNAFFSEYNNGEELPNDLWQGMAGFYDVNSDAVYNPTHGDYPYLEIRGCEELFPDQPDEFLWFVFNDITPHTQSNMATTRVEIQCTVFAYNCQESPLGNSVFVRYKFINRATEDIEETYFGNFMDFEIGNGSDDFFGSDSGRAMVFAYNGDNDDEGGYGTNPAVMSVDLFRGPLDEQGDQLPLTHVMPISNVGPATPVEYYNLLRGLYEDGSPAPNNGFLYDGNPTDPTAWSEVTDGNSPGDRRVLASYGPFTLQPGAVNEMILNYSFNQMPKGSVEENLGGMYLQADAAQAIFDNCFESIGECTQAVSATVEQSLIPLSVSPNPTANELMVKMPVGQVTDLEIVSLNGQLMQRTAVDPASNQAALYLGRLPAGFYFLNAYKNGARMATEKVVVCH